jgi:hypothetical protein
LENYAPIFIQSSSIDPKPFYNHKFAPRWHSNIASFSLEISPNIYGAGGLHAMGQAMGGKRLIVGEYFKFYLSSRSVGRCGFPLVDVFVYGGSRRWAKPQEK